MAGQQGGYRQPSNPAPVSGPGALSKRTDGGPMAGPNPAQAPKYMPGLEYGQGGNMAQQKAAPIAGAPSAPTAQVPQVVPLSAPTQRPNEPVMAGVDRGPGPGSEALITPNPARSISHVVRQAAKNDPSGDYELLWQQLANRGL
jgi:hypothetical protein